MTASASSNAPVQSSGKSPEPTGKTSTGTASRATRESKADKGLRYIKEGRLTVTRVDGDVVRAECRGGSGEVYTLGYENGHWNCSCLARVDCSHLSALWRVTVRPR